uniref:bifunctional hydroxymethylpyrimidine kinase/phosphomethylpyrimidine kinase n=1 Tax=Bosea sp. (in: a-proteobacteria) TaxID=1871050 RepID=UPI002FC7B77C
VGAGETLAAALASLLASGQDLHLAVSEALSFVDQSLDAGFRPGMGNVVPDRFFWALPEGEEAVEGEGPPGEVLLEDPPAAERGPRRIH